MKKVLLLGAILGAAYVVTKKLTAMGIATTPETGDGKDNSDKDVETDLKSRTPAYDAYDKVSKNNSSNGDIKTTPIDKNGNLDKVQEASEESFPASDSPSHY